VVSIVIELIFKFEQNNDDDDALIFEDEKETEYRSKISAEIGKEDRRSLSFSNLSLCVSIR